MEVNASLQLLLINFWDFMKLLLCYLKSMNYWKQQEPKATNDFGGKSSCALPFVKQL
jgi:hypothetical protein